jgi:hypothetical protein
VGSDRLSVVGCLACTESHRWPRGGKGGGGGDDRSIGDEGERMTRDAQRLLDAFYTAHVTPSSRKLKVISVET